MQKYKIEQLLGEGSFGCVYLVKNVQGQKFAYKRIKVDPFHAQQAEQEIDIMRRFTHPHLVRVYEHHFQEEKQQLHLIMEYCQGGDLAHYFSQNKNISSKTILSIMGQVVQAFVAMSAKGVMHRDLKPQNIMLTSKDTIKIADFGCAKLVDVNNLSMIDSRSIEKGTYLYVSPQQLKMEKYSFKCDVWAAGCIAYLLQYRTHPFLEANPHNVLQQINQKAHTRPIELPPASDPAIAIFIHLSLLYDDIERASWRELQLCRIFAPKINSIDKYIAYVRSLSPFANDIVKEVWKIHKEIKFSNYLDEILIYYLVKFQMNNLKHCLRLFKKIESVAYLFEKAAFDSYEPKEDTFNEVKKNYLEYEKYFNSIKKTIEAKECFTHYIGPFEPRRVSSFVDLDKSIRTAYKILKQVKGDLPNNHTKNSRVWLLLAKWINFQQWFTFEKEANLKKAMLLPVENVVEQINEALLQYENGSSL